MFIRTITREVDDYLNSFDQLYYSCRLDSFCYYSGTIEITDNDIIVKGPEAGVIKKIIDENMEQWGGNKLPIEIGGKVGNVLWDGIRLVNIDDPDFKFAVHEVLMDNGYMFTKLEDFKYVPVSSQEDIERVKRECNEKQKEV